MNSPTSAPLGNASTGAFQNGLVFGFDAGSGSIGWAVRRGADFRDVAFLDLNHDNTLRQSDPVHGP